MNMTLIQDTVANFYSEILIMVVFGVVGVVKFIISNRLMIREIKSEAQMEEERNRFEKHEDEIDELRNILDDFVDVAERLDRHFTGDDNDPTNHGLIVDVHDLKDELREINRMMREIERQSDEIEFDEE